MVYIYVLKLNNNKYYVGKTNNPKFRLKSHFNSNGSIWTKKYKPIKCIELNEGDEFDENKNTLKYMNLYGINNVRGGSFCEMKLSEPTIQHLTKMLDTANDRCYSCGEKGHFIQQCPHQLNSSDHSDYSDSEEYYWSCEYCGKEFDTVEECVLHENKYCKKNSFLKRVKNISCYRCGRKGHYASNCNATKDNKLFKNE